MKRVLRAALLFLLLMGAAGCMKAENTSGLIITAGKVNIQYVEFDNAQDSLINSKKDFFKFAFEKDASSGIEYIKIDEKVCLDFGSSPPDKLLIKDKIINSNGENAYNDKETMEVPYTNEGNKFYYTVKKHSASGFSSYYEEGKTDFRGLTVKASWGENERIYAFVIKTDAFFTNR